jgi:hypothetical protein
MSDLTLVLSGALAARGPAKHALTDVGYTVADHTHSWGLPSDEATGWLTATGGQVDKAVKALAGLGWSLRAHWNTPEPKPEDRTLESRLAVIEAKLGVK